ncbi:Fasciclin-like arabinogalactan protein 2 [Hibiscus syriacus]|uniref:Fasciclin-like arabinogalactan protein 2 n=1 Tax=Hibiscus syriacus TaxID=106335 RepID=A0A6A3CN05_HIBSY|nr:fasciclin-like arabinogalactan protein 2 [Hibiscus syriacus]KAE8730533.1 Fasciclin-like arabinogalactan protein 2 [Hibiscus syriacus]
MSPATTSLFPSLALFFLLFSTSNAHNITRILAKHPEFSTFNHYLTVTHLAAEINRRQTITVLALNNAAMSSLLSKQLSLYTLKNVLSLHVLVDYFGSKKLHQITNGTALTSTMFQATGAAPGSSGYINITDLKGGKVGFGAENNDGKLDAVYVKAVAELPYNISVLQISQPLNSAEAEAPTAEPSQLNLTAIMSKQGCKAFADLLISSGADATFNQNIDGGLTVFCPTDPVIKDFMPKYKNLTASKKASLLLYHGIPVYQSMQMLKSNNGIMNTLATDGANKYDFTIQNDGEVVTLETKVVTAKITGTLKDEEPLIVFKINKVLLPRELFKPAEDVADSPAESPKPSKSKHKVVADSPESDAPSDPADDQTADNENGVAGLDGRRLVMVLVSFCIGVLLM